MPLGLTFPKIRRLDGPDSIGKPCSLKAGNYGVKMPHKDNIHFSQDDDVKNMKKDIKRISEKIDEFDKGNKILEERLRKLIEHFEDMEKRISVLEFTPPSLQGGPEFKKILKEEEDDGFISK